jgi:mannose-6-phosphate isomerase-like protein (cupin superfamily)
MDIQAYIKSGILEEYCMGQLSGEEQAFLIQMTLLYPEIKKALTEVELLIEKLAISAAVEPRPVIKDRIFTELGFVSADIQLNIMKLAAIDKNADHEAWLRAVNSLIHDKPADGFVRHELRKDDHLQQMLVIAATDVAEEEHGDYLESFLILKGDCECTVGNDLFKLSAGDFIAIPLHVKHDIKILSPHVVAVLQYQFV